MKKAANFDHQLMLQQDKSHSECCTASQSGWTLYLDHSHSHPILPNSFQLKTEQEQKSEESEEEDSSMLSDASSGPPHVHEEEDNISCSCDEGDVCLCNALTSVAKNGIKRRRDEKEKQEISQDSFLEDTASSTLFTISEVTTTSSCSRKKLLMEDDHSCCFSATDFKGNTALRKHLDYLHSSTGLQTRR